MKRDFPIIEFDAVSDNVISATANVDLSIILPERCVISFFGDAVKALIKEKSGRYIGKLVMESFEIPLYVYESENGHDVVVLHGLGSGPYAAGQMEKLISLGSRYFMVCGGCGVLEKDSKTGEIFIPISAVRDEGTSYHYIEPSREIEMNIKVKEQISTFLENKGISFKCVKTWTTDAMYRETRNMIDLRIKEGCQVVEMECASYLAVAQYKDVMLGQLLYAGDDLSGNQWDSRNWKSKTDIRKYLLKLTMDLCGMIC